MSQDEATIRKKARDLLQSRRLPPGRPDGVWSVNGSGRDRCPVCGDLVAPDEMAIEAEFRGPDRLSTFHFHVGCFWALESERRIGPASGSTLERPRLAGDAVGPRCAHRGPE